MNASDYDRQVNWEKRLAAEWPFYRELFREHRVSSILDCACGTGRHAILFAKNGLSVTGIDIDSERIKLAHENAVGAGVDVRFETAAFSELNRLFSLPKFDAVICVGNSLSQLPGLPAVEEAIRSMAAVCRPGGMLVLHVLNYRSLLKKEMVAQPLRVVGGEGHRELFQKIFLPRTHQVEIVTVHVREGINGWSSEVARGMLLPIDAACLEKLVIRAGFSRVVMRGDYSGAPFDGEASWDLILTAVRT
ncbi:MAG: class I SAM-dependent methyltransferase [Candidatus Aureabacteria bacterium]|nr:class I SAM-dependent methyltransferase [Candidatus Auribacterota bacterium]